MVDISLILGVVIGFVVRMHVIGAIVFRVVVGLGLRLRIMMIVTGPSLVVVHGFRLWAGVVTWLVVVVVDRFWFRSVVVSWLWFIVVNVVMVVFFL